MGDGKVRLRHADRQVPEPGRLVIGDLAGRLRGVLHPGRSVDLSCNCLDLLLDRDVERVEKSEIRRLVARGDHGLGQRPRPGAAAGEVVRLHRGERPGLHRRPLDDLDLSRGIGREPVYRNDDRDPEDARDLDVPSQVDAAPLHQFRVLLCVRRIERPTDDHPRPAPRAS